MGDRIRSYRDLKAWQKAMGLAEGVYAETRKLPAGERYGLIAQMRRCAVSVPSNIAEGWGRGPSQECVRFLTIARGSTFEISTQAELCHRLELKGRWEDILTAAEEVGRILQGLIRSQHR